MEILIFWLVMGFLVKLCLNLYEDGKGNIFMRITAFGLLMLITFVASCVVF